MIIIVDKLTEEQFKEQMDLQVQYYNMKKQFDIENSRICYLDLLLCKDILKEIEQYAKPNDVRVKLYSPKSVWEFKQNKYQITWLEDNGYICKSLIEATFDYGGRSISHYDIGVLTSKGKEMLDDIRYLNQHSRFALWYYKCKYFKCWSLEKVCLLVTAFSTLITLLISFISFIKQ